MSSKTGVIDSQLDLLSDVLEDFCTKHNIELMSADDILYGSSDNELSNYQREWLRNYISIWDTIANLWGLITMFKSESFGRIFWVDDSDDFKSCPQNIDGTGDFDQWDYVSEWTDWEGVNMETLLNIHQSCVINKNNHANSLTLEGV